MNLEAGLSQNRRKTAIARTDYSRPIRIAMSDGLIDPTTTVFDYGCGLGDDLRHLGLRGIPSWGWDPEHRRDGTLAPAQIVNLGYVVNVIEDGLARVECLKRAWSFAQGALIVSARLATDTADLKPAGAYGDGVVTSIGTFQKFYEQGEFKDWLDEHLPEPAVPAGLGVFYVFREATDRIGFLASRYRRRASAVLPTVDLSIEAHKEMLQPLIEFFERRGRAPADDELPGSEAIRERLGSLRRALRLIERGHNSETWKQIVLSRGQDLLLFLALARFDGRPLFGQLPMEMRRDIKSLFSTYRSACEQADVALLAVGDMSRVLRAAQRSPVGKVTPSAIYVHESALDSLPPLLRLYEGCARRYIGRVEDANLVKLHTTEPMISYLAYPAFETDPHPALAHSLTVHLQTFRVRQRNYRSSRNPPILHRKETFITPDHQLHAKFATPDPTGGSQGAIRGHDTYRHPGWVEPATEGPRGHVARAPGCSRPKGRLTVSMIDLPQHDPSVHHGLGDTHGTKSIEHVAEQFATPSHAPCASGAV